MMKNPNDVKQNNKAPEPPPSLPPSPLPTSSAQDKEEYLDGWDIGGEG